MTTGIKFFRKSVLKGKTNFDSLFKGGARFQGKGIALLVYRTRREEPVKLAVCVSKRGSTAVFRNRLKRITRESVNEMIPSIKEGYHVALFPRKGFEKMNSQDRGGALHRLLVDAGLFDSGLQKTRNLSSSSHGRVGR